MKEGCFLCVKGNTYMCFLVPSFPPHPRDEMALEEIRKAWTYRKKMCEEKFPWWPHLNSSTFMCILPVFCVYRFVYLYLYCIYYFVSCFNLKISYFPNYCVLYLNLSFGDFCCVAVPALVGLHIPSCYTRLPIRLLRWAS